jgi:hypothetical protein
MGLQIKASGKQYYGRLWRSEELLEAVMLKKMDTTLYKY